MNFFMCIKLIYGRRISHPDVDTFQVLLDLFRISIISIVCCTKLQCMLLYHTLGNVMKQHHPNSILNVCMWTKIAKDNTLFFQWCILFLQVN